MLRNFLFPLLIIIFSCSAGHSQVAHNRLNVYLNMGAGRSFGDDVNDNAGLLTPSLFSNLGFWSVFQAKTLYRFNNFISWGAGISHYSGRYWGHEKYSDYSGLILNHVNITPTLRLHSVHKDSGFRNNKKMYLELAPVISMMNIKLNNSLTEIHDQGNINSPAMKSTDFPFGMRATAGVELSISGRSGIFLAYSVDYLKTSGIFYTDEILFRGTFEYGIIFKFLPKHP
jgi:hypothetical protein